jgi:osmotically-inducible protein OsmY
MSGNGSKARTLGRFVVAGALLLAVVVLDGGTVFAAEHPNDGTISYWVKNALREDPRVPSERVKVSAIEGIVTLSGEVRTLAASRYAEREAEKIDGVRGVINELEVKTSPRFDMDIAQDILERILHDSSIETPGIEVDVSDGVVTLGGEVHSWAEVEEAKLLAMETTGVRSVVDHMTLKAPKERSDEEILKDVRAALRRDSYLSGLAIDAAVTDGVVKLGGDVGTLYQKKRAARDVRWIRNVTDVDNRLEVHWWDDEGVREGPAQPTNDQLRTAVHDELVQDLRIEPYDVTVEAEGGHVTLRGSVPTFQQSRIAEKDARDVMGTAWVTNLLAVNEARRSDKAILDDARFELDSDSTPGMDGVTVKITDGVARLSGEVNTFWERSHAHDLVSRVKGVRKVIDNLTVDYRSSFSDASIRTRIENRLAANSETRGVAADIRVAVDDGKVTLTGTVNFWSEYQEAENLAFRTDGAWAVVNRLRVREFDYDWPGFLYPLPLTHRPDVHYPAFVYFYLWS